MSRFSQKIGRRWLTPALALLLLGIGSAPVWAQGAAVRIARFQGDRAAAVSLTFDDALRDQDLHAVPLLARYGFHGTFFVVAGTVANTDEEAAKRQPGEFGGIGWPRLKALAQQGHEIANHSLTHANLCAIDDAGLEKEITQAYQLIAEKIGTPPLTFCYPGNGYDARVHQAVMRQHIFARETQYTYGGANFTPQGNAWVDDAIAHGGWIVAMIHGITEGYSPFANLDEFAQHLAYLKQHEDKVWVDTFANVARYTQERDSALLSANFHPNAVTITVTCPLDPKRYNIPLTIVIPVHNATQAVAKRASATLPVTVRADAILVDLAPSEKAVEVSWVTK